MYSSKVNRLSKIIRIQQYTSDQLMLYIFQEMKLRQQITAKTRKIPNQMKSPVKLTGRSSKNKNIFLRKSILSVVVWFTLPNKK